MLPHQRAFLDLALAKNALRFGEFTLKSGRVSPYFFNAGMIDSGAALATLGQAYAQAALDSVNQLSQQLGALGPLMRTGAQLISQLGPFHITAWQAFKTTSRSDLRCESSRPRPVAVIRSIFPCSFASARTPSWVRSSKPPCPIK